MPVELDTDVTNFIVSPDSSKVIYIKNYSYLYGSPITTSAPRLLATEARNFAITPDSSWVVFTTMFGSLYSVPITGGTLISIDSENSTDDFLLTPDSKMIVYRKSRRNSFTGFFAGYTFGLYSSPITASVPVTIDPGDEWRTQ